MKVTQTGTNVIASHGVASEANFQIRASAQAFRILSSGLYSDKISAVLREIGCNAADSHVAAGIPERPIEVKLPTPLDSAFYIKDWGTGLTHEDVTGLFTTYFSSNKGESNEMTGAFGLGSKSPFSYTDSFMVTVVKDGVKRFYTAHIGVDGSPVITMLGDGEPAQEDWPSGMMVSFPVQPKDVPEFRTKARKVFSWFRVAPTLLGAEEVTTPEFLIRGSNFWLGAKDTEQNLARVIMGNVAYPLNKERLGVTDTLITALVKAGVHIQVPIGSVMPTASREELEYDPATRAYLTETLTSVAKEIAERIHALAVEPTPTEWERHVRLRHFARCLPMQLAPCSDSLLRLLNLSQEEHSLVRKLFSKEQCELPIWAGQRGNSGAQEEVNFRVHLYRQGGRLNTISRREVIEGYVTRGSKQEPASVSYEEQVQIVIGDAPHTHERIKSQLQSGCDRMVMISVTGGTKQTVDALHTCAMQLAQQLGGLVVIKSSMLAVPFKLKKSKADAGRPRPEVTYGKEMVSYWETGSSDIQSATPRSLSEVPATGRFYVVSDRHRHRFVVRIGGTAVGSWEVGKLMHAYRRLQKLGIPVTPIEGVVVTTTAKVKTLELREGGWQSLFTAISDSLGSAEVLEVLGRQASRLPKITLDQDHYSSNREGLLLMLAREAHRKTPLWQALALLLQEHPQLRLMIKELLVANKAGHPQVQVREALNDLARDWPSLKERVASLNLIELDGVEDTLEKIYPLAAFVSARAFLKTGRDNHAQAIQYLQGVLRIKADRDEDLVVEQEAPQVLAEAS